MKTKQPMQKTHLMKFILATSLVLALLIIETVVGVALYRHAEAVANNSQMNDYKRSVARLSQSIGATLEASETEAPSMTGTLNGASLTFDKTGKTYVADSGIASNLSSQSIHIYRLSEIFNNFSADESIKSDSTVYVIYSRKNEDDSINLSFFSLTAILSGVSFEEFGGIAIFSPSGRWEYINRAGYEGDDIHTGSRDAMSKLLEYRLELSNAALGSAKMVKIGDAAYVLSVAPLDVAPGYTVGGYSDFSGENSALSGFLALIIGSVIAIALFTAVAVYAAAYWLGRKNEKDVYRFKLDSDGMILQKNKLFEADFPHVREIAERVNRFREGQVYVIKPEDDEKGKLLSCTVKKNFDGTLDVEGRELFLPAGDSIEVERRESMPVIFNAISEEHQKVLLGEIYFNNLLEIKDVFGREFAESIRTVLLDRVQKRFEHVFLFDYYTLGVLQSDGPILQIMMRDMERVVSDLNRVVKIGDNQVLVNIKCGFALGDAAVRALPYDDVMAAADAALRRACEPSVDALHRVDYYIFQESQRKLYSRYLFKIDIPQMLANGDFYLEYQPQYSLSKDRIVGFEALFRVNRRVQISVSIIDIIEYAEKSGKMVLLGNFILNEGMKFAKSIEGKGVSVSLNVSPVQMMQTGFVDNFLKIYNSYELQPGSISVEITESYLMSDVTETLSKLNILRNNGIDIHLDDFGTGYSSFSYLSVLPISTIKVDQSFVRDITTNRLDALITKTVADICKSLGLDSICEGVETPEQLEILRGLGCDIMQGYLISRSVGEAAARDMIDHYHYTPPAPTSPEEPASGKK